MSGPSEETVRAEVRAWLEEHWSPERGLTEWRVLLADSGWGCPTWPRAWCGREFPEPLAEVVREEFERAGAVGVAQGGGTALAAVTLLEHGSEEQKRARCGRRALITRATECSSPAPTGTGRSTRGSPTSRSRWISRASRCGHCAK